MNSVNKTLYIPLYGKAYVSAKGIILDDKKAQEIWAEQGISLKGKSRSKWLAYYMAMRSAVFDCWTKLQMDDDKQAVVIHIGCGLDSRVLRIGTHGHAWYDVDFPDVIAERKRYYSETTDYCMIESDARANAWIDMLPRGKSAIIVMEGVSMYFAPDELKQLLSRLTGYFANTKILMDQYTVFAAKASKYKNPINDVGVTVVYGIDDPVMLEDGTGLRFVRELEMTPDRLINELGGTEKKIFRAVYAGKLSKKMYRLYEYESGGER